MTDAVVAELFARAPPPLCPKGIYSASLKPMIAALDEHELVVAAVHLANGDIWACHDIVQAREGEPSADWMHAILHRREGDAWNSKYWYARLGSKGLPTPREGAAFVDECEMKGEDEALKTRQWDDLRRLVEWVREQFKERK